MSEESPSPGELPSNLVSEFFVQILGRIIPGAILIWLYLGFQTSAESALISLCAAWVAGTALEIGSEALAHLAWYIICGRRVEKKLGPTHTGKRRGFLDPCHPFVSRLERDKQRAMNWLIFDKNTIRCVGVIFLVSFFFPPRNWPNYGDSSVIPWHYLNHGKFFAFIGMALCVVCWVKLQKSLIDEGRNAPNAFP
jgi:hypothetical protein